MEEQQNKPQDRLQLLGLLAPVILLLTLFCSIFKKTPLNAYLYITVMGALPAIWYYRLKGFLSSCAAHLVLFLSFYSFIAKGDRLWHFGASLSLLLGLFIVFMGFEEVRHFLKRLKVESKSRLDNLMKLDEEFQRAQETWKLDEAEIREELEQKKATLKREGEELAALEKLTSTLRDELAEQQVSHDALLNSLEEKAREISALEAKSIRLTAEHKQIEQVLQRSQGDRELDALRQTERLKEQLALKEEEIEHLQEQIENERQAQTSLDEEVERKEEAFRSMQEALRQKVATIQEQQEKLQIKEQAIIQQKEEISELFETISQKEHEVLTVKSGLNERDFQIQKLNQKQRDLQQDLNTARSIIEEKKLEIKNLEAAKENDCMKLEQNLRNQRGQLEIQAQQLESKTREVKERDRQIEKLSEEIKLHLEKLEKQEQEFNRMQEREEELRDKQFEELKKLNDARFALYQANLDKERAKSQASKNQVDVKKHWLLQIEQLLRGERAKNINFKELPHDLSKELLTLNQTKALYKQLRAQFDEKQEVLESTRKELYEVETKLEKLERDEAPAATYSEAEKSLEECLSQKAEEAQALENEVEILNGMIASLMKEKEESSLES